MISNKLFCAVFLLSVAVHAIGDENSFLQVNLDSTQTKRINVVTSKRETLQEIKYYIGPTLGGFDINLFWLPLKFDPIQGEAVDIAIKRAQEAVKRFRDSALVDVFSLEFNSLQGQPGPNYEEIYKKSGNQEVVKMLSGYQDKSAVAKSVYVYLKSAESEPQVFVGEARGWIVDPVDVKGFTWETIFVPEGYQQTLAELDEFTRKYIKPSGFALYSFESYILEKSNRI